jgi:hypothetical protein
MEAPAAGQPWQAAGDGWVVLDDLQGRVFQVGPGLGGKGQGAWETLEPLRGSWPHSRFPHRCHGILP